jgi:hypothetical protein
MRCLLCGAVTTAHASYTTVSCFLLQVACCVS